ncbi:uncharacterized protein STEHIDRAFT_144460 [Stereum hirsutum FP-91666 SS1]|uniref:uncharacterized protein n=1 Tax=Stereum hirsutum (strain FP-91666) TaxID=721885 RepID=UPI000441043E|nr:uncharacterized protein STEHIDRAFT_144460 [Stereum hirsutum FP-91666 SS1]EIM90998.1 hypothetical protein STEHIDRAFT_144460 [Stereum hirsutum FP-91666 SS1]
MRVGTFFAAAVLLVTSVFAVEVAPMDEVEVEEMDTQPDPEVLVVASFPESNPFGHVVNGERNQMWLNIENNLGKNVTLLTAAGEFRYPDSDKTLKTLSNLTYGINLMEGAKIRLPYSFHSEFKPGDLKLNLWVQHEAEGNTYIVPAFDGIVTVVEPELSVFDLKMLSTYATVLALLSGLGYIAYQTYVPQTTRKPRKEAVSAPVGPVTASGAGGYQEEWIPEHHRKRAAKKGAVSSGDELSGAETSGTEGKRRKGKK